MTLTVPNNDIAYAEFDYEGFEGAVQRFEVTIDPRDVSVLKIAKIASNLTESLLMLQKVKRVVYYRS